LLKNHFEIHFCSKKNHYHDLSFISNDKQKLALDLKSTYRKENGILNCLLYILRHYANKSKIFSFGEMDADHVLAWSKSEKNSLPQHSSFLPNLACSLTRFTRHKFRSKKCPDFIQ